jgi:glucoside 3-dehydrogenase (cytochrome c) hitch-hiker subunit
MAERTMNDTAAPTTTSNAASGFSRTGHTRREVLQYVSVLLGGAALTGGDRVLALSFDDDALVQATAQGTQLFTAADVAMLDEIADTILPATSTPGAKAAKTGAFMALMVTDAYTDRQQQVFTAGLRQVDEASRTAYGVPFLPATPAQRLSIVQALDRQQKAAMDARAPEQTRRAPAAPAAPDEPAHYFRMMKELALLGYFSSEIGCTQAMRYRESPGRFDPCAPYAPGDKSWASHA